MSSATAIRQEIESSLAARIPGALSVRFPQAPEMVATGIAEVDGLLSGGLPLGELSEIVGPACSGKTTLVSSLLAGGDEARGGLRLCGCGRRVRSALRCRSWDRSGTPAVGARGANLGKICGKILLGASGSGAARNGSAAQRGRVSRGRAGYGRRVGCGRRTGAACAFGIVVSLSAASGEIAGAFPAADANSVREELCFGGIALWGREGTLGIRRREGLAAIGRI